MKNKKIKTLGAISIGTVTLGLLVAIVSANGGFDNFVSAGEHSSDCVWNHYAYTAPQENKPGNKEYWVCCVDHESVFTEPTVGKINDGTKQLTDEQIKALGKDDPRYISPSNVTSVIEAITNLPNLDMSGGVIPNVGYQVVLDKYNEISNEYKEEVTNRDKLLEFNDYFECVVSSSDMEAFEETTISDDVDSTYGTYRGFTCTWDKTQAEKQSAYSLITDINFDEYDYFTFAIYNPNATIGWHFTANDFNHYLDLTKKTIIEQYPPATSTMPQGWNVITLSSDVMKSLFIDSAKNFQSIYWGPYLGGSANYGLQYGETIKITNFYGIKSAYYEAQAQSTVNKINALTNLDKTKLTLWNGGQILEARSEYDALSETVKKYVTNLSTLEEYETAYATIGTVLNYQWGIGTLGNQTVISSSSINYDAMYGLYTEVSATDSTWCCNFTPIGSATISKAVKFAVYNPTENNISIFVYANEWALITNLTANANAWTELEIPVNAFKDGFVNGVTFALSDVKSITGLKLTSIYQAA